MAVTHVPQHDADDLPVMADGIGMWGWIALFAVFGLALLLVAYF